MKIINKTTGKELLETRKRYGDERTELKLSGKAEMAYDNSDPLVIYERETENGALLYDVTGIIEAYDLSYDALISTLEYLYFETIIEIDGA